MPRYAANGPSNFESIHFGGGEAGFVAQRRRSPSSFDFVVDDDRSAPLGLPPDATSQGRPHAAHYLFNSMPCAYAWFHH
jgi:hypothetical protein